jgi:hypothetical protein
MSLREPIAMALVRDSFPNGEHTMKTHLLLLTCLVFFGCTERPLLEPVTCPPDAEVPRYSQLIAVPGCVTCHSSTLVGEARAGAPSPINFDTHENAKQSAVVGLFALERGTMPPEGALSEEAVLQWETWSSCGRPE